MSKGENVEETEFAWQLRQHDVNERMRALGWSIPKPDWEISLEEKLVKESEPSKLERRTK